MDTNSIKNVIDWFNSLTFQDEPVRPTRQRVHVGKLPAQLRTARSLENKVSNNWQSRETIFTKQAKLLAEYEDDFEFHGEVQCFYAPTYQSLNDQQLRGYFTWRTRLRKRQVQDTPIAFALLYVFELLNLIGVDSPQDGYQKLCEFRDTNRTLDQSILSDLDKWIFDFVIYYDLPPELLSQSLNVVFDNSIEVLLNPECRSEQELVNAARVLSPRWLNRSGFYTKHREDMDVVIAAVLRQIYTHYASRHAKPMVEQFIGACTVYPVRLFDTAVFLDQIKEGVREYVVDPIRVYKYNKGFWSVSCYSGSFQPRLKLDDVLKTIDAKMRPSYGYRPIIAPLKMKWLDKIISNEVDKFYKQKEEAEKKKLKLDPKTLNKIRLDAAVTRDALLVDEELEDEENTPTPAVKPTDTEEQTMSLSAQEYRLVQCLLYGRDIDWVQTEGQLLSVLVDSVNEKLYDVFQDTVLVLEDRVLVVDDYIDDLKEMVKP